MTKVMFGKTTKTDVVLKYKKLKDNIYVYKLKYKVKGNKIDTYGLCFEDDIPLLEEKLLIPKRLLNYNVYYKEFLEKMRKSESVLECEHKIALKDFFNKDESLIPVCEDCIVLKAIAPNIPETISNSKKIFYFEYFGNEPIPTVVHVGCFNEKKILDPLVCEDNYDLEDCLKILKKRKDIEFSILGDIRLVKESFFFVEEYEETQKISNDIGEKKYLNFFWCPEKEDWIKYYRQLENYGFDVANKFLVDEILKLKRKGE